MKDRPVHINFSSELFNPIYMPFYKTMDRYLFFYGGAGSGKSEFAAAKLLIRMLKEKQHRFLICRKIARTIRNSQYQLLKEVVMRWGLMELFDFKDGEMRVTCVPNGNEIIAAGLDNVEKLKSITGITGIWVEELTELSAVDWRQLNLRMRGWRTSYKQTIATFNPIDEHHWVKKQFFNNITDTESPVHSFAIETEHDTLRFTSLRTTHRDNKFLDNSDRAMLESLQNEDENYYRIYALGLWGAQTKGLVFNSWSIVPETPANTDFETFGIDFGFSNPSAVVKVSVKDKKVFLQELLYEKGLTNPDIIQRCDRYGVNKKAYMYLDAAEPDRIEEFYRAGYNAFPAEKDVKAGIEFCQRFELCITADSSNLIREIRTYKWKTDKNGNALDEPLKFYDHLMDAVRYALYSHHKLFPNIFGVERSAKSHYRERKRERKDITEGF